MCEKILHMYQRVSMIPPTLLELESSLTLKLWLLEILTTTQINGIDFHNGTSYYSDFSVFSLACAHEHMHVHNVRDFSQAKPERKIN